jgi:D-arabinose 1-dehydrogenase-like Zn-dependent alcohol dehydrogenase
MTGAFVVGDRKVVVRELPKPEPRHGEVLIRASVVGICGSDLHSYRAEPRPASEQLVTGHELVGVVEKTGPGVQSVRVGERIVA